MANKFYISVPGNSIARSIQGPTVDYIIISEKLDTQACAVAINLNLGRVRSVSSFDNI